MKLRTGRAKVGTCLAHDCKATASGERVWRSDPLAPDPTEGIESADGLCKKHRAARNIEMRMRTSRGEVAQVLNIQDYVRDPLTGRVDRR